MGGSTCAREAASAKDPAAASAAPPCSSKYAASLSLGAGLAGLAGQATDRRGHGLCGRLGEVTTAAERGAHLAIPGKTAKQVAE
jgi:hypothetical protein